MIKGVATRFYGEEWYKYVAWSNICKAAPSHKGNPSDKVFYDTLENNIKVFNAELDFWSPKYIVLLTDGISRTDNTRIDWTGDFLRSLNGGEIPGPVLEMAWDDDYPEIKTVVYKFGERYAILSLHPQRRKVSLHTEAIIKIIETIENGEIL